MHNPASLLYRFSPSLVSKTHPRSLSWSVLFLLMVGLTVGWARNAQAESPETAPAQLKDALAKIDAAATRRDAKGVMQFYAGNFKNSDGLTAASMEKALTQLWTRYPQLTYRTEIRDWKREGNAIVAETVTSITGTQPSDGKNAKLESTLRSRQRFEGDKIVQQQILAERTQISSGANPPNVQINLPEQVGVGQSFNFDAIVKEPVGDNILLGTALEEPIKADLYTKPSKFDLQLLPAGGIFKVGKAPAKPEDRWISAILIRGDGMTMVTQRLQVVNRPSAAATPSK
jgi:ketosteroid isomerase-like protein